MARGNATAGINSACMGESCKLRVAADSSAFEKGGVWRGIMQRRGVTVRVWKSVKNCVSSLTVLFNKSEAKI